MSKIKHCMWTQTEQNISNETAQVWLDFMLPSGPLDGW